MKRKMNNNLKKVSVFAIFLVLSLLPSWMIVSGVETEHVIKTSVSSVSGGDGCYNASYFLAADFYDTNASTICGSGTVLDGDGDCITISSFNLSGGVGTETDPIWSSNLSLGISGNLTPSLNNTFDLGSFQQQWKDFYIEGDIVFDNNRYIRWDSDTMQLKGGNVHLMVADRTPMRVTYGTTYSAVSFVHNENGGNWNFRIEGDTDQFLLFTDADQDKICIGCGAGTNIPRTKLDVRGKVNVSSYVNASFFFGDGSGLTNLDVSTANTSYVLKVGDTITGSLNISKNLTISGDIRGGVTYVVTYIDLLAATDDNILGLRTWQSETIDTFDSQPVVPRSIRIVTLPEIFGTMVGTVNLLCMDADGYNITESIDINDNVQTTHESNIACAKVLTITTVQTDETIDSFYSVGIDEKIGLPNYPFEKQGDVFKVKKSKADVAVGTVAPAYGTVDLSGTGIALDDDFTFWYRPFR